MAKIVFDKIESYIASLPDAIEKGMAAITIRAVDRYALQFYQRVLQDTPFQRLRGSITLEKTFKKGRYGYRLLFDGYDENNTPLQMIANVFNTGRADGFGIAETGRRYAYGRIDGIKFMTNNLELLGGINQEIGRNSEIGSWKVSDGNITTNDGTTFNVADLNKYVTMIEQGGQ